MATILAAARLDISQIMLSYIPLPVITANYIATDCYSAKAETGSRSTNRLHFPPITAAAAATTKLLIEKLEQNPHQACILPKLGMQRNFILKDINKVLEENMHQMTVK